MRVFTIEEALTEIRDEFNELLVEYNELVRYRQLGYTTMDQIIGDDDTPSNVIPFHEHLRV